MAHDAIGFTATVITLKFTQFNYFKKCTQMQIQNCRVVWLYVEKRNKNNSGVASVCDVAESL